MLREAARVSGALLLFSTILLGSRSAAAYCRTTTDGLKEGCRLSTLDCCSVGKPLFWKNACVGYSMQKAASKQVTLDEASAGMAQAFATWSSAQCDGGKVGIDVKDMGPVDCAEVEYNSDQANQHVIVFRDGSWDHSDPNNTLALTTLTFDPDTGEIFDADMEINTAQQHLTVHDPIPRDGFDFLSVITHESGHFLGLAHTGDATATMFPRYKQGSTTLRVLHTDDTQGICAAYPADGTRVTAAGAVAADACDPTPRHGQMSGCGVPQHTGCSIAAAPALSSPSSPSSPGAPPLGSFAALGLFGLVTLVTRRRTQP